MKTLKVQSCKLHNQYITASTQITNTKIVTFIALLVFKLLSRKVLLIKENAMETVKKEANFFLKIANFTGKLLQNYK